MGGKRYLGVDVLEAARRRIDRVFSDFGAVYCSFSGGKDSTVMLHLVAESARKLGRRFGLLFVDLEAQFELTIDHVKQCFEMYGDCSDPYWVSLPLALRNAVSAFEPKWTCWDPDAKDLWVRKPPKIAIDDEGHFDFFTRGMEFEHFVAEFGECYSDCMTACFVGIRTQESLNRWRSLASSKKRKWGGLNWTTHMGGRVVNAYPIYDWQTEDVWTYHARFPDLPYNRLYDRMWEAGLTIHQARICQPYGDDQRRGLWLYQVVEPDTWAKVLARVTSANFGARHSQDGGNILGWGKITLPDGHTWESFSKLILATMPEVSRLHYENKIAVFLKWWQDRGYPHGIPDEVPRHPEVSRSAPSWRRIAKTLLRQDWWCKGLSFSQTKAEAYSRYMRVMEERRRRWGFLGI